MGSAIFLLQASDWNCSSWGPSMGSEWGWSAIYNPSTVDCGPSTHRIIRLNSSSGVRPKKLHTIIVKIGLNYLQMSLVVFRTVHQLLKPIGRWLPVSGLSAYARYL